jgi:hypothetical protein
MMPRRAEEVVDRFEPEYQMCSEWRAVHDNIQENYRNLVKWQTEADLSQNAGLPQWMYRLPEAYKTFFARYAEKNSGQVIDSMLAVHTHNTFDKQGLGWSNRSQFFDLGDRVTTFVSTNDPPGVPSVGGEAAQGGEVVQEAVLRWTPSEDVLRHLCLDSRGVHLMSLLR